MNVELWAVQQECLIYKCTNLKLTARSRHITAWIYGITIMPYTIPFTERVETTAGRPGGPFFAKARKNLCGPNVEMICLTVSIVRILYNVHLLMPQLLYKHRWLSSSIEAVQIVQTFKFKYCSDKSYKCNLNVYRNYSSCCG